MDTGIGQTGQSRAEGRLSSEEWETIAKAAWHVRSQAFILGDTRVGAAVLTAEGLVFAGCNVEHRFRCHDIHAEVNAIGNMISAGQHQIRGIIVAASRKRFTPCGGCLDWIFQFGGADCEVGYQREPNGEIVSYLARDLMPQYPE